MIIKMLFEGQYLFINNTKKVLLFIMLFSAALLLGNSNDPTKNSTTFGGGLTSYTSSNIPIVIPAVGTSIVTSTLTVPLAEDGVITDINIMNTDITHDYIDDINITLISPAGTRVTVLAGPCGFEDNINIGFDDEGLDRTTMSCPPVDGLRYQPENVLSAFDGENSVGVWTLEIADNADLDGGTLNGWEIQMVTDIPPYVACLNPPSCTYAYSGGTCSDINLDLGETLCINSGTFTCNVSFNDYGTIYIAAGAYFSPSNLNNFKGQIINCGTSYLPVVILSSGTAIQNYGEMNMYLPPIFNGPSYIYNSDLATLNVSGDINVSQNSSFINDGYLNVNGSFSITNSTVTNNNSITATQNILISGGSTILTNNGVMQSGIDINVNTGTSLVNNCTYIAEGTIIINAAFQNNGLFYCKSGTGHIIINNASVLTNNGDFVGNDLTINGDILGNGQFWFSDVTSQNGNSDIGMDQKGLNFYDATPGANTHFDTQLGNIDPSVTTTPPASPDDIPDNEDFPSECSYIFRESLNEICNNFIDDDGDGLIDCEDPDCTFLIEANITSDYNGRDVSCFFVADGAAQAEVIKGGVEPFTYLWDSGFMGDSATSLLPITHVVTITDANGCNALDTVELQNTPFLEAFYFEQSPESCAGVANGTSRDSIIGGTTPYSFTWSNGETGRNLTNASEGNYMVTITDVNDCTTTSSVYISLDYIFDGGVSYTTSYNGSHISCLGETDGGVLAHPWIGDPSNLSGIAPYTYLWNTGDTTDSLNNIGAGDYFVTITDGNGCTDTETITVVAPPEITIDITVAASPACGNAGALNAVGLGGSGITGYLWSNGTIGSYAGSLTEGTYTVTVTDTNGCTDSDSYTFPNDPTCCQALAPNLTKN